ncbi:MAG: sigma factor [Chloroflexota bacterium]|nr:sigma factor [Chloroflexota bacterium]
MDLTLIRRSQAGDEEAFAALFHKYKNLVYKTAYLQLGDAKEAEDALQEVFVKVYESLDTYDPEKAPSPPGCIASRLTTASTEGASGIRFSFRCTKFVRWPATCLRPNAGCG